MPLSLLLVTFLDVAFSAQDLSVFRVVRPTLGPGDDMIDVGLILGGCDALLVLFRWNSLDTTTFASGLAFVTRSVVLLDQGLFLLGEASARPSSSHNVRRWCLGGFIPRKAAHLVYTDCLLESRTPCHTWAARKQQETEQKNHGSGPSHVCMMRDAGKKNQSCQRMLADSRAELAQP
jgi:hypothetical protein